MPGPISKAATLYRNRGLFAFLKRSVSYPYETLVRPRLQRQVVHYNGVAVLGARTGDRYLPWRATDRPTYEGTLVAGIDTTVEPGDTVVVVGGGWGVSTVTAARAAGPEGAVHTFEAGAEAVETVGETVALNDIAERVSLRHAVVAEDIATRGSAADADVVAPADLPDCDVLVLDCEGAELSIIDGIETLPRAIVVETHGHLDAPPETVRERLEAHGYAVTDEGIAEPRKESFCRENGIQVLRAIRGGA